MVAEEERYLIGPETELIFIAFAESGSLKGVRPLQMYCNMLFPLFVYSAPARE